MGTIAPTGVEPGTITHLPADTPPPSNTGPDAAPSGDTLDVGTTLGGRYKIQRMLGEGGMGAVYKATDLEVDRVVALKVIRPEYANRPEILARFKQELVLARQITHRNVIRIFDMGQADGIRFITMEYVEGQDLYSLLKRGEALTLERKVKIAREICKALEAAHEQGVVHRDLKPQNIMVEKSGRVLVMDFGIARSMEDTGLTSTGALIGTPAFMSPEQAKGDKLDTRSDLFSFGVIFYELLTGKAPYQSDTAVGLLIKRIQERPKPPIDLDKELPQALSDIVLKCLVVDRDQRYQTAAEVIRDLEGWLGDPASFRTELTLPAPTSIVPAPPTQMGLTMEGKTAAGPRMRLIAESNTAKWVLGAVAVVAVLLAIVYAANRQFSKPAGPVAPMTVIIADFNNHTGDPVFSGTLESSLKLALEGASFISAYDRTRMRELGVPAVSGTLDDVKAQSIAASQGLNVVVTGSLDRKGTEYQLSMRALQTVTGKVIIEAEETAAGKDQVLFAVAKLGTAVRKALGDSTSESAQRLSMESLSATSLEAVHEYAAGLDMLSAGKFAEAQAHLSQAVDLDPNFGMAYTIMASADRNQGHFQDAEKHMKEALKHIDRMTERERYRTRAYTYLLSGEQQKCVEEYSALLERYPADTGAYTNIAVCLVHLHNVPKALEYARKAVAILPKRATYHSNLAMNLAYGGDFTGAAAEAMETVKLGYPTGYLIQAFAMLGQEQPGKAAEAYHNFEKTLPSDASTGFADLAIYEGRYSEAVGILEKGAVEDTAGSKSDPDAAATKYWMLARVQLLRGQDGAALTAAKRALELSKAFQTRLVVGQVYTQLGEDTKARDLAAGLSAEPQIEPQAYGKLIEGEIAVKKRDFAAAIQRFTEANKVLDTWLGRFDLGRAYLEAGMFVEADSEFDRCIKRRGEALALFLDQATYGYFPPVYYYQGRAREGMKTAGFRESYRKYLNIRGKDIGGKAAEDPLVADARRRANP
jgi:serine/threonine protein kinase/tetratricopeptide (TPR) repeat protein